MDDRNRTDEDRAVVKCLMCAGTCYVLGKGPGVVGGIVPCPDCHALGYRSA